MGTAGRAESKSVLLFTSLQNSYLVATQRASQQTAARPAGQGGGGREEWRHCVRGVQKRKRQASVAMGSDENEMRAQTSGAMRARLRLCVMSARGGRGVRPSRACCLTPLVEEGDATATLHTRRNE